MKNKYATIKYEFTPEFIQKLLVLCLQRLVLLEAALMATT